MKPNMRGIIALCVTVGFLAIVGGLSYGTFTSGDSPAILIMFGSLSAAFGAVIGYYFGSADMPRASQRKTDGANGKEQA